MKFPGHDSSSQIIKLMNHQRHDWLNHIQVLLGQLSLKNYDACKNYLYTLVDRLNNEGQVLKLGNPDFILYLLTYSVRYPSIQFEIEIPSPVDLEKRGITREELELVMEWNELYGRYVLMGNEELPSLLLRISSDKERVVFEFDLAGVFLWQECMSQMELLHQQLAEKRVQYIEQELNENEWVVQLVFLR